MNSMFGSTGLSPNQTNTGKAFKEKVPSGYKAGTLQQFTPEQMQLFQQLFSHVGPNSFLSKLAGGDEGIFNQIEAPALKQFSGLQGNLASRFSGMGLGARHSSGFQNTSNQFASDFAQQLQSQRQALQMQALEELMGLSGSLLGQRPYERFLTEKKPSIFQQLLGFGAQNAGRAAQGYSSGAGYAAGLGGF